MPAGKPMPALGFGTFQLDESTAEKCVADALEIGYRHIDTADMYGNHEGVGRGLRQSGLGREDIYLVTKIWRDRLRPDEVLADANRSLEELQVDYVDQLLIHWPNNDIPMSETFSAMDQMVKEGKVRTVGVSNFTIAHVREAMDASPQPIAANQVEFHPYLYQKEVMEFCQDNDVALVAYRPIVKGEVKEDPLLQDLAGHYNATPVQVALRWCLQHGLVAIPRSSTRDHIEENWKALEIELGPDDMERIDNIQKTERRVDPDFAEFDRT
jgi:2,5-diketo-D-gluconate reductase B